MGIRTKRGRLNKANYTVVNCLWKKRLHVSIPFTLCKQQWHSCIIVMVAGLGTSYMHIVQPVVLLFYHWCFSNCTKTVLLKKSSRSVYSLLVYALKSSSGKWFDRPQLRQRWSICVSIFFIVQPDQDMIISVLLSLNVSL